MIIKTNQEAIALFCAEMKLECELLIDDSPHVDQTPFIFVQGEAVEQMINLTKSPKTRMLIKMLG